jgi:hypothetical protein
MSERFVFANPEQREKVRQVLRQYKCGSDMCTQCDDNALCETHETVLFEHHVRSIRFTDPFPSGNP